MTFACIAGAWTASLVTLSGCDSRDPYMRTDVWQPTGANAGNIAAMVVDPHDLISGHGTPVQNASEPALAVGHVWQDQPKPLVPGQGGGSGATAASPSSGAGGSGSPGS
jgi:type IV pilus biogenesis protein CpaD/CtpE